MEASVGGSDVGVSDAESDGGGPALACSNVIAVVWRNVHAVNFFASRVGQL
ncbi:MAG: hypothetical protein H7288_04065 [Kineosporiaceae bacterium]|nr:hypothetical protein [Aeromicrobium sp.]